MLKRPTAVASIAVAAACLAFTSFARSLPAAPGQVAPKPAPGAADATDTTVMSRRFVVGTSNNVRQLMKENPQGYRFSGAPKDVRVDERAAPRSCGVPLAKYSATRSSRRSESRLTNDCRISAEKSSTVSEPAAGRLLAHLLLFSPTRGVTLKSIQAGNPAERLVGRGQESAAERRRHRVDGTYVFDLPGLKCWRRDSNPPLNARSNGDRGSARGRHSCSWPCWATGRAGEAQSSPAESLLQRFLVARGALSLPNWRTFYRLAAAGP